MHIGTFLQKKLKLTADNQSILYFKRSEEKKNIVPVELKNCVHHYW